MRTKNVVLALAAISLLAGCGSFFERKQVDYKAGAVEVPPLEVPPDMTVAVTEPRYTMPATDGTQVAKYSDFSREKSVSAPMVAAPAATEVVPAKLLEVGGVRFILLNESFERSWRKVGLALDRARIVVGDMDRSKGIYFLKVVDKEKKADDVQVLVHEANGTTDVTVKEGGSLSGKEAARVLDALLQNLEK
jgi:outer membrane protein assembly factor BamC